MRRCSGLFPRRPLVPQMIQVYFLEGSVGADKFVSIVVLEFLSWRCEASKFFRLFAVHPEGLCLRGSSLSDTLQDIEGRFWMLFSKTLCLFLCGFDCFVYGGWSAVPVSVNIVVWFHSVSCSFLL